MRLCTIVLLLTVAAMLSVAGSCAVAQDAVAAPPAVPVDAVATPADAQAPPQATATPAELGTAMREEGLAKAIAGDFSAAVETLNEAAELLGDDEVTNSALELLNEHQIKLGQSEAVRAQEYADDVTRVRRGMMVQAVHDQLVEDEDYKQLQQMVDDLFDEYKAMPIIDELAEAGADETDELTAATLLASDAAMAIVAGLVETSGAMDSEYGREFVEVSREFTRQFEAYRKQWVESDLSSLPAIASAAHDLRELEGKLAMAASDVKVMVADSPWQRALGQATMAKQLASETDDITAQPWYIELIAENEARGLELIEQANWEDALVVYAGLEEIDKDNAEYRRMVKLVAKHVRVLRYYGKAEDDAGELNDPLWEEIAKGIDVEMVRTIISQVDSVYVMSVDYHKLVDAALTSIRVLAETPQAADSFETLADDELREEFLAALDKTSEHFTSKDGALDYLDLLLAMNYVLDASERTVNIPSGVLAMEFGDGMLGALDRFSSAIWPNEVEQFRKQTKGHFTGVGIQVGKEPGEPLRVITPIAGTPAFRAGIKMGDFIVAVDGVNTRDMAMSAVIDRIVGKKGTTVVLRIERKGVAKPFDVPVKRDKINILSVKGWRMEQDGQWDYLLDADNNIGYIRITRFTEQTARDLDRALKKLNSQGVESIILDFRLNPGGLLHQATQMANEFVPSGQIVMTQGRQVLRSRKKADWRGDFIEGDLVVLVDEYTASASEIVAGALEDLDRAIVIGQRSFGKGSVQQVLTVSPPPHQALLKLTAAYYYVGPSEKLVHRKDGATQWGVEPDIEVRMTPGQMRHWLDIRQRTDLIHDINADTLDRDLAEQLDADIQLTTALTVLRLKRLADSAHAEQSLATQGE